MDIIKPNDKVIAQVRALFESQQKLQEHINSFMSGVATSLDVPTDWVFDTTTMGFIPSPEVTQPRGPIDQIQVPLEE